jgi:Flp pilus assembly protein TadG
MKFRNKLFSSSQKLTAAFLTHLQTFVSDTRASQILEFAVSVPLLTVLMVGIIDFSSAFNLKHKLDIAVQEGARVGASQPLSDVTNAAPQSTAAIRDAVAGYLTSVNVNDCGLAAAPTTAPGGASGLAWTYTANTGCAGGGTATLTIDRGATFPTTGAPPLHVSGVAITISYPYQWRFGRVIRLISGGSGPTGVTQISTSATMQNLN